MKLIFIFALSILFFTLFADNIETQNGKIIEGAILGATENHVNIHVVDSTEIKIPHMDIKSIFFTYADMVYLTKQNPVKCKILNEKYPVLTVVTSKGLSKIRYTDVKRYFFNTADSLTIPYLPPTITGLFNNEKIYLTSRSSFQQRIAVGLQAGLNYIGTKDWEENFLSPSSSPGIFGGIIVGYNFLEYLTIGLGYEYGYHGNTIESDLEMEFNTNFIFASTEFSKKFVFSFIIDAFAGIDAGLFNVNGNFYLYSYRNIEFSDNGYRFALKPKIGVRFPVSDNFALGLQVGYLFTETNPIKIPVKLIDDFSIKFNGISLTARLKYYFPYSL